MAKEWDGTHSPFDGYQVRTDAFRDCIDAIKGAISLGQQDANPPPEGHWLAEFWQIGRNLAASPAAQGWQPIETAPKDGTEILLTNGKTVAEGQWCDEEPYIREYRDADGRWIDQQESDGFEGWMDWSGGMKPGPTHWMPLPPAPDMSATPPAGDQQ